MNKQLYNKEEINNKREKETYMRSSTEGKYSNMNRSAKGRHGYGKLPS